jgi:hypothetical protein
VPSAGRRLRRLILRSSRARNGVFAGSESNHSRARLKPALVFTGFQYS